MFIVRCDGCGAETITGCACPPEMANVPAHVADCPMLDLGAQVTCPPDSGCCQKPHSHDQAANACAVDHTGQPCPHPDPLACPTFRSGPGKGGPGTGISCDPDAHAAGQHTACPAHGDGCPGGHHAKGVEGCAVCRPVTISLVPGYTVLRPVEADR
jgi:hypothetical protein